eukprot:gene613-812_t
MYDTSLLTSSFSLDEPDQAGSVDRRGREDQGCHLDVVRHLSVDRLLLADEPTTFASSTWSSGVCRLSGEETAEDENIPDGKRAP